MDERRSRTKGLLFERRGLERAGAILLALALNVLFLNFPNVEVASSARFDIQNHDEYRRVPVVMIVFDEFPVASLMNDAGEIDAEHYPNFARLSDDATWYRNTSTVGVFTHEALPSILTGKSFEPGTTMTDVHPRNLFTLLGDSYRVRTHEHLPGFCPANLCRLSRPDPASGELGPRFNSFATGERGTNFGSFLDLIEAPQEDEKRPFYFGHLVLPHSPWRYLPSGQRYLEESPEPGEVDIPGPGRAWDRDGWLTTQVYQRHLLQTGLTDRLVGALIDRLEEAGIYDESLVVVTADHGIAFQPGHPKRLIDAATVGHVAPIPLFIKQPHQRVGRISDRPTEVTDILPTIADILRLSDVWHDLDGTSAFDEDASFNADRRIEGLVLDPMGSEKFEVVQRKYRLFGTPDGSLDLFSAAPGGVSSILGRPADDVHPYVATDEVVEIDDLPMHVDADPRAPMFPALLEGSVPGTEERRIVAISVDGVVRAVTRTYLEDGHARFYAMLDPSDFDSAPNDIDAFVLLRPEA
ncbi:MAG: sulfatase-like hydrolase/transferase [Actinomycetota bacterium]